MVQHPRDAFHGQRLLEAVVVHQNIGRDHQIELAAVEDLGDHIQVHRFNERRKLRIDGDGADAGRGGRRS